MCGCAYIIFFSLDYKNMYINFKKIVNYCGKMKDYPQSLPPSLNLHTYALILEILSPHSDFSLWPMARGKSDSVVVSSVGLKRPHVLPLSFLCLSHCCENNITWLAYWC